jgi:hypothetical protein
MVMRHLNGRTHRGMIAFLLFLVPLAVSAESIHIGDVSLRPLNASRSTYTAVSSFVSRFDLVAAEEIRDAGSMEKVLAGMDENWEAAVSRRGFFGFIYNGRVQLVRDLGTYPGKQFKQPPYGAQFRLAGTRFAFNLVACQATENAGLSAVYRHFERLTGNRGMTILVAGGGQMIASPALRTRIEKAGVDSVILIEAPHP